MVHCENWHYFIIYDYCKKVAVAVFLKKGQFFKAMKVVPGVTPVHSEHRKYVHSLHEPTHHKEGGLTPKHPMLKSDVRSCVTRDSFQIPAQFTTVPIRAGTGNGTLTKNVVDICAVLPIKELRNGRSVCDIVTPSNLLQTIFLNAQNRSLFYCPDKARNVNEMWFPANGYGSLSVDAALDRPNLSVDVREFSFFGAKGFGEMQGFFHSPFSSSTNPDALANTHQFGNSQPASITPFNMFDLAKVPFGATISYLTIAPSATRSYSQVLLSDTNCLVIDAPLWVSQRVILQKGMIVSRTRPTAYVRRSGEISYEPLRYLDLQTGFHTSDMYHRFTADDVGKPLTPPYSTLINGAPTTGDSLAWNLGRTSTMSRVNESMVGFTVPELFSLYKSFTDYDVGSRQLLDNCANPILGAADGYRITNSGRINDPWNLSSLFDCTRFQASKVTVRFPSSKEVQQGIMQRLVLGDGRDHYSLSPFEIINHDETHTMNVTADHDSQISAVYCPVVEDDVRWDFESVNGFGDRAYAVILLTGLLGGSSTLASVASTPVPYNIHIEVQQRWEVYDPNDGVSGSPHPDSDFIVNVGKAILSNMRPATTGGSPPYDSAPSPMQVDYVHSVANSASQNPSFKSTPIVSPRSHLTYQSTGSPTVRYLTTNGTPIRTSTRPRSGIVDTAQRVADDLAGAIPNRDLRRRATRVVDQVAKAFREATSSSPARGRVRSRTPSVTPARSKSRTVSGTTPLHSGPGRMNVRGKRSRAKYTQ